MFRASAALVAVFLALSMVAMLSEAQQNCSYYITLKNNSPLNLIYKGLFPGQLRYRNLGDVNARANRSFVITNPSPSSDDPTVISLQFGCSGDPNCDGAWPLLKLAFMVTTDTYMAPAPGAVMPDGFDLDADGNIASGGKCVYIGNLIFSGGPSTPNPNPPAGKNVAAIVKRATSIVGQPSTNYSAPQVVSYAVYGNKNKGPNCGAFQLWGVDCGQPGKAVVAIASDNSHCGIFANPQRFIYTSSKASTVIAVDPNKLQYIFPGGYNLRCPPTA
jgi:hypothetical protein